MGQSPLGVGSPQHPQPRASEGAGGGDGGRGAGQAAPPAAASNDGSNIPSNIPSVGGALRKKVAGAQVPSP